MYHGDGRTPEQVAQQGCGITTFGDTKKFTGQVSQQPDLTEPCFVRGTGGDDLRKSLPTSVFL